MHILIKILILLTVSLGPLKLFSAEIIKGNKKAVIIIYDPFDENFVVGDRFYTLEEGLRVGVVEVTKVKGAKILARVLQGRAAPGMGLEKYNVVAEVKTKEVESASETVTLRIASTYVWRGIPSNRPHVSASADYADIDVLAGVLIQNTDPPATSEADFYLGHSFNGLNGSITPKLWFYTFPGSGRLDTWDMTLNVSYRVFALDFSYSPRFYGDDSDCVYAMASTLFGIGQRWKMGGSMGVSLFSKEKAVGYKNYSDFKGAFVYTATEFTAEFAWTDTLRRAYVDDKPFNDSTAAVTFSKTF